jgi:hypothetical protein
MHPNRGTGVVARASRWNLTSVLVAVALLSMAPLARGQTDNFNDGNDTGWTRYAPLDPAPTPDTSYTFPDGGYRINTPPSPSPATLGPGRAGSFRPDANYSQFYASIDVVNWNDALDQAFGLLTRVTDPGAGTTKGYAFTYSTQGPSIDISRVTGEVPAGVKSMALTTPLDPAQDYRFVFTGEGTVLTGSVYTLGDLNTPIATITGADATYASGITGLVVFDNTSATAPQVGGDATFDNFAAGVVPEPGSAAMLLVVGAWALRRRRGDAPSH